MCFNGPKTWQLGWFPDYHVDLTVSDLANGMSWSGNLVGFAEKAAATQTDKMIIRIKSVNDTYINFNRAIDMNVGTQEGEDQVHVTTRPSGTGYSLSNLVAKLSDDAPISEYNITYFNGTSGTLRIKVNAIETSTTPWRASISIDLIEVPTEAPTKAPTQAPTQAPTLAPTAAPQAEAPTGSPTQVPTNAATQAPTQASTESPTQAPTQAPTTRAPSSKPTTRAPTSRKPTTLRPTSRKPTTRKPTNRKPTTRKPTTRKPTTRKPTTRKPTTRKPTTRKPTTRKPTTRRPSTRKPTRKRA